MPPAKSLFPELDYSWNRVYHHFRRWSKMDVWEKIGTSLLKSSRIRVDLCHVNFDGSHTLRTKGGGKNKLSGQEKKKNNKFIVPDR